MEDLLRNYIADVQKIYGSHLKQIILYGSYARGDFTPDSDVDVMLLVDLPEDRLDESADMLSEIGFDYNVAHDIWFMPIVKNIDHFHYWCKSYPFYSNVVKEGISLYEAA
ncbi:MAG: nucleotidyltransferase domain-containing protein [Lachnospiraceae bacterium]|nr:nucleotidyltransferase domain-containing protein [Lachnospiraceae bacterium]